MTNSKCHPFRLLLLSGLLSATFAQADQLSAVINGVSKHVNSSYEWNEANYGLGLEYRFDNHSRWKKTLMANGFRDSNNKMSYMAGGGLHRRLFETADLAGFYVDLGVNVFLMTREDVNGNRPFPGALPSVAIGNQLLGLNLTYLPRQAVQEMVNAEVVDPTISGILFVQFKISIDQLLP
jgi:hypothetical protein